MTEERYTVRVNGKQVSKGYMDYEDALYLSDQYFEDGYDDVVIEDSGGMQ